MVLVDTMATGADSPDRRPGFRCRAGTSVSADRIHRPVRLSATVLEVCLMHAALLPRSVRSVARPKNFIRRFAQRKGLNWADVDEEEKSILRLKRYIIKT